MRDDEVSAFLREADLHLGRAEDLLRGLEGDRSAPMRRMRAALYLKAMRRLRHLIETHRPLPLDRPAPPALPVHGRRSPWLRWMPPLRERGPPARASAEGSARSSAKSHDP